VVLPRNSISKIFWALSRGPGAQHHHFRIPLLALRTLGFFPASPPHLRPCETVESNLQRHPYAKIVRHIQGCPTCGPYTLHDPHTLKRPAMAAHPTFFKFLLRHSQPPTSPYTLPPCPNTLKRLTTAGPILLLCLPSFLLPSGFPITILHAFLSFPTRTLQHAQYVSAFLI